MPDDITSTWRSPMAVARPRGLRRLPAEHVRAVEHQSRIFVGRQVAIDEGGGGEVHGATDAGLKPVLAGIHVDDDDALVLQRPVANDRLIRVLSTKNPRDPRPVLKKSARSASPVRQRSARSASPSVKDPRDPDYADFHGPASTKSPPSRQIRMNPRPVPTNPEIRVIRVS